MIYTSKDYERMTDEAIRKDSENKLAELLERISTKPPKAFIGAILTGYARAWNEAAEKQIEANAESGWSAELLSSEAATIRETLRNIFES